MLSGYSHFVQLAESLQWDETAIDLTPDAAAWHEIQQEEQERVHGLIAGFCIGEAAVATQLQSFQVAATDETMAAGFKAQARDEARHARFFDRVAAEVVGVDGETMPQRFDAFRDRVSPELVGLFEERLPAVAEDLAGDHGQLTGAVGLYHMILEGVVLTAGQHALLDALSKLSVKMPGTHKGMELVLRDERWHIGFGSRVIQSSEVQDEQMEEILVEGEKAASAWGDLIDPGSIDKVTQLHRRRLKAVGIKFW